MKTLCLIAATHLSNPPPPQLQEMFKNRTAQQLRAQNPWLEVKTDQSHCEHNATYDFTEGALQVRMPQEMAPHNPILNAAYEDLFEGYKLQFDPLRPPPTAQASGTPTWVWWSLGIAAGVGLATVIVANQNRGDQSQSGSQTATDIPSGTNSGQGPRKQIGIGTSW